MTQKITIISGTNRDNAVSLQIANQYMEMLTEKKCEVSLVDLNSLPDDFTSTALYDQAGKNDDFNVMRNTMSNAEKFIFIVPEYNGSFPGVLKAFIDGLKFPQTFKDKKAALVGLSSGVQGGGLAVSHLTDILNYCGTHVLALKLKLSRIEHNMTNGKVSDSLYLELIEEQVEKFLLF